MIKSMDILQAMAARLPEGRTAYLNRCPKGFTRPSHFMALEGREAEFTQGMASITAQYRVLSYAQTTDPAGNCDYAELCALAEEALGIAAGGRVIVDGRHMYVKSAKQAMFNDAAETVFTLQYGDVIVENAEKIEPVIHDVAIAYGGGEI